jgi:hypothetical protein
MDAESQELKIQIDMHTCPAIITGVETRGGGSTATTQSGESTFLFYQITRPQAAIHFIRPKLPLPQTLSKLPKAARTYPKRVICCYNCKQTTLLPTWLNLMGCLVSTGLYSKERGRVSDLDGAGRLGGTF